MTVGIKKYKRKIVMCKKKFLRITTTLIITAFFSPVSAMNNADDDIEERLQDIGYALQLHSALNEITGTPHEHLFKAIQATTDEQIEEYFGSAGVTRDDLLNVNVVQNQAKHQWENSQGNEWSRLGEEGRNGSRICPDNHGQYNPYPDRNCNNDKRDYSNPRSLAASPHNAARIGNNNGYVNPYHLNEISSSRTGNNMGTYNSYISNQNSSPSQSYSIQNKTQNELRPKEASTEQNDKCSCDHIFCGILWTGSDSQGYCRKKDFTERIGVTSHGLHYRFKGYSDGYGSKCHKCGR